MASIRAKGRGFEVRIHKDGRSLSRTLPSKDAAQAWAEGIKHGFITLHSPSHAHWITLSEACERYEREVIPSHKGARQEINRLQHIRRLAVATRELTKITADDLKAYRDDLIKRGLSASTVRLNLAILGAIFNHAKTEWGIQCENPVAQIRKPKVDNARSRRFRLGEEERLMHALSQCKNPTVKRLVAFLLETAMRKSEALNLEWEDIDLSEQTVVLKDTKNGASRWVPISASTVAELQNLAMHHKKPFPITVTALDQAWGHAVKRAGIVNFRIHDLRHESLSRWAHVLKGDVFRLASISGHRTLSMLGRYIHPVMARTLAKGIDSNKASD